MSKELLNKRKAELLKVQSDMLTAAVTNKAKLTDTQEKQFNDATAELDEINTNLARFEAIAKGKSEVGTPREVPVVSNEKTQTKFWAMGGYRTPTELPEVTTDYTKKFWSSLKSSSTFERFLIQNAVLGEGGTTAAGGALVPIETDPSIPAMAIEETACRSLSRVITTEMDINLPYQSAKTAAALKAESTSSGTNAFAESDPTFATTKLTAYVIGGKVTASWELLEDVKAASQFIPFDLQRAIRVKEENYFVNGTGSGQPQGYLGNGTTAVGADVTAGAATLGINPILDTVSTLNRAYYNNAKWLVNRQEFNRLLKKQIALSQYQTFVTFDPDGTARLLGYEVEFSAEMPVFNASPAVNGAWLFGDFNAFAVIGDRGDSNIRVKVLDQVAALNGQTVILGYRRVDQHILLAEAVVQLNTNG
jgi:HK97 family phage major capsid protein